ncbi:MAG: signal peptidase I [Eubacterium sp.]|nr:signal peptidase I [Eubacterium sp.]
MKRINKGSRQSPEARAPRANKPPSLAEDLVYLLAKMGVVAIVIFALFAFVFGLTPVTDAGMEPAFNPGDLVMYYRLDKDYSQSDAIVVEADGEKQIRRVVAKGGDTVDFTDQGLVINGALQQEPDTATKTLPYEEGVSYPITLAEDEVFVLGDARDGASDSRAYGPVKLSDTCGKVMALLRRRQF